MKTPRAPLPSPDAALIEAAKLGSQKAAQLLIAKHEPFIAKFVRRLGRPEIFADLMAAGRLGIMRAIHEFDLSQPHRFLTFAGWKVRGELKTALRKLTPDDPKNLHRLVEGRVDWAAGIRIEDRTAELDALEAAIQDLPEPDKTVIRRRLDGWTLHRIAKKISVSHSQVALIEERARGRLREALEGER